MENTTASDSGLALWLELSANEAWRELPPLPRLIQALRERSQSADELLELAFALCEAHLAISRHEYSRWQGWAILDATSVFSLEGLGGELVHTHGYDFWSFLRAIADLARRSHDPAQYHQCINHNLFSSPAEDELVLQRLHAMEHSTELRSRGCMVDTAKLLNSLVKPEPVTEQANNPLPQRSRQLLITPRQTPEAFGGYGRSLKLNLEGKLLVRGPYCLNVCLEQPFHWLASIQLQASWLSNSTVALDYELQLEQNNAGQLRLLLATTAAEPAEPGRGERHFWLHNALLPADASEGVKVPMDPSHWRALKGHPLEAYGLKCSEADPALIDQQPVELILALEAGLETPTPTGQLSLPNLKAVASRQGID